MMRTATLDTTFLADPVLLAVWDALPAARLVGGCVRDAVAGQPVADFDFATPDQPDAIMRALRRAGLRAIPTGLAHGTVTAVHEGQSFEITTLRRDADTDGRHARVEWTDDWREDAARRDFTFNAMSLARDGRLSDPFGGAVDLQAGHVRFVGDPAIRLAEDYLRALRFFRFHARYGQGDPEPAALQAIRQAAPKLAQLSVERVWSELQRILVAGDPGNALRGMARSDVLQAVLPEGADPERLLRLIAAGLPDDPVLRLAALVTGDVQGAAERLRLSNADRAALKALASAPDLPADADDADLRRALADWPAPALIGRAWLMAPDATSLRARLGAMTAPEFPIAGRDALAAGMPAGPRVGKMLQDLRAWWLAGGCSAGAEECRAELHRRLSG